MKKIVFVSQRLYGGGAERVLVSLANYFSKKDFEVYIVSRYGETGCYPTEKDVNVEFLESQSNLQFVKQLRSRIKSIRPTTVISFEYFYNLLSVIACLGVRVKLVISERNDPAIVGAGLIKDTIRNFLYRFADVLVCQTPDAADYFPQYINRKTTIIANPLKDGLPLAYHGDRSKQIVTFCQLRKQKNIPLLLESFEIALKDIPDYQLVIYGSGDQEQIIMDKIQELHINNSVIMHPLCLDVHSKIIKASMYVSSSDYEGLSNSMLEAMAIGLPTICTDCPCGGARMVINNNINGVLVPVRDKFALAKAMVKVATDKDFSLHLSYEGSKLSDQLSMEVIGTQWIKLTEK